MLTDKKQKIDCALSNIQTLLKNHLKTRTTETEIEIQHKPIQLISHMPFIKMIQDNSQFPREVKIPVVSRAYEERFLRQSIYHGEKDCVQGELCEAMFIDPNQPFVCTQFIIPNVKKEEQHLCVMCLRKVTQLLFYKTIYRGLDVRRIIQRYGNIANQRGEYSSDAMIMCHPNGPVQCMPLPIVAHQRNHYQVYDVSGVKHIKQIGVDSKNF
jgi:hypothetical protein